MQKWCNQYADATTGCSQDFGSFPATTLTLTFCFLSRRRIHSGNRLRSKVKMALDCSWRSLVTPTRASALSKKASLREMTMDCGHTRGYLSPNLDVGEVAEGSCPRRNQRGEVERPGIKKTREKRSTDQGSKRGEGRQKSTTAEPFSVAAPARAPVRRLWTSAGCRMPPWRCWRRRGPRRPRPAQRTGWA